jgi:hypothetical protein
MNYILILLSTCFLLVQDVSARRAARSVARSEAKNVAAVLTVAPDIDRHTGQFRDVDALVERAKRDAEYVKRSAEREKEAIESKVRRNQTRLERRRQELLQKDTERQLRLEEQARKDAELAQKRAEQRAHSIVIEAERKAEELKRALQEQEVQDRLHGRVAITREWRKEIIRDFEKDTGFIRQVIMEGEVSRTERQNFIALFTEQQEWLTQTIEQAEFFFDESYNAVIAKKNALAALVDAQKQADDLILDMVGEYHLPAQVQAQLRLMALYEINNHLQHTENPTLFVQADVIENLVTKIGVDVFPGKKEIVIVTEKEKVGTLQARISELELRLAEEDTTGKEKKAAELAALKKERDEAEAAIARTSAMHEQERALFVQAVEQKQREKIELELVLAQVHSQMGLVRKASIDVVSQLTQRIESQNAHCKELGSLLEEKQQEAIVLTVQTQAMQRTMQEALTQAALYAEQVDQETKKSVQSAQRITELELVAGRINESQAEIARLMNHITQQQNELSERRNAYAKMQKLQMKLEKARQARKADAQRSAEHIQLLTKMNAFGDQVLAEYTQLQMNAHNAQKVHSQLAQLLSRLRQQGTQGLDHTHVLSTLDAALLLLQHGITSEGSTFEHGTVEDHAALHPDLQEDSFLKHQGSDKKARARRLEVLERVL